MCGITGYSGAGDEKILRSMNDTLKHRGPDDEGFHVAGNVGLAQRRLSIIDLSPGGHQPMSSEDDTVWIVFNGEIYNFLDLKKKLKQQHTWKGSSDTEVIIHLYEEVGEKVFSLIQGMFAIALYDSKANKLMLARDRMGKKPLFWSVQDGQQGPTSLQRGRTLLFASELKALMAHPDFKREIDPISLNKYFLYEYVPTPHSIFKNTYKLEPGTLLIWNGKEAIKKQFWKPTFFPKETSFQDALKKLDQNLSDAVKDRLVADVPLGIFLSGGLDSSAIAYYASKAHPGKVKTFSIGFTEKSFDESGYAKKVAEHLKTDHYEKILSIDEGLKLIPKIGESLDEPMADSSIVPTYLLSQFTREHVMVALGGDGGDELFAGYDPFIAHRLAGFYDILPRFVRKGIVEPLARLLPTSHSNMSLDFKIKRFISGFDVPKKYRNQVWLGAFNREERQKLFNSNVWNAVQSENEFDDVDNVLNSSDSKDFYDELALVYERMYMMDQVLVKVDRASMMNSLEVRAPFLDTRVVDLANHMPIEFKMKGLTRKYILKKLMEGKLPHDIIYRKKKGFGLPVGQWINGGLKPLVLDLLGKQSIETMKLFNYSEIERILNEHFSGKKDNRKQIWSLLIFAMWWRRWVKGDK